MRPTTDFVREVWIIRHAQSESNAGLATTTPTDIQLTELGQQQSKRIAQAIVNVPSLVVTSPYHRTRQTAEPTLKKFYEPRHCVWPVQEFTYLSPPKYRNTSRSDRLPMVTKYWNQADPEFVDGEGAESFSDLMHRVETMRLSLTPAGKIHEEGTTATKETAKKQATPLALPCQQATRSQQLQSDRLDQIGDFVLIFSHGLFINALRWQQMNPNASVTATYMKGFHAFHQCFPVQNGAILKCKIDSRGHYWASATLETSHL